LPDAGSLFPGGLRKRELIGRDRLRLERLVAETRRAEWVHLGIWPCWPGWGPDWNKGLSLQPIISWRGQTETMQDSSPDGGPYRVRFADRHERSVPDEVRGPRFGCLDDALAFAHLQVNSRNAALIVEKLAPGGCWLQMARLD